MVSLFCLRLAWGVTLALWLLPAAQVNPRLYRTQLLVALGLGLLALLFGAASFGSFAWAALGVALLALLVGSLVWLLEGAPGSRSLLLLASIGLGGALWTVSHQLHPQRSWGLILVDDSTSAALLGSATTAMVVGHFYLLAPAMSLTPLRRSILAVGGSTLLRLGVALISLWTWRAAVSGSLENDTLLWLGVRWGSGLLAPLVLGWMAWETTRLRATQAATGILYVVVIVCFLGELLSQLLLHQTGYIL
jgi:hypothetical protein